MLYFRHPSFDSVLSFEVFWIWMTCRSTQQECGENKVIIAAGVLFFFSAHAWGNWDFWGDKNWEKNLEKLGNNWAKLGKTGQNWAKLEKTGENWVKLGELTELNEIGRKIQQNRSKLGKTGKNWVKLRKTGQNWAKLEKIEFRRNVWCIFYAFPLVDQVYHHFFGARVRKLRF